MIRNPEQLEGVLPDAWLETACRDIDGKPEHTRFNFLVDENDDVLGSVTSRYLLIRSRDAVNAVLAAIERRKIDVEIGKVSYHKGVSKTEIRMPMAEFKVSGDPSTLQPCIIVKNDYRGNGGLKTAGGVFRLVCSNGLMIGTTSYRSNIRHVGKSFDLSKWAEDAVKATLEAGAENQRFVAMLAVKQVDTMPNGLPFCARDGRKLELVLPKGTPEYLKAIYEATSLRMVDALSAAIHDYRDTLGSTLWCVLNAVTDLATHQMKAGPATDAWVETCLNIIRAELD